MTVEIIEESPAALPEYEQVPIAFRVTSRFLITPINGGLGGLKFLEESVVPYVKDYDVNESERPSQWFKSPEAADPFQAFPAIRKWHKGAKATEFSRIVPATRVYRIEQQPEQ